MVSNVGGDKPEGKESQRLSSSDLVGPTSERIRSSVEDFPENTTKSRGRFWRKGKKDGDNAKAKEKEAKEELPPVPFLQLFRFVQSLCVVICCQAHLLTDLLHRLRSS